ncbi:MAG: hypothetical protein A2Z16_12530 [Chloroflexi bacterium RBG_16_54_18]|nr:MAG: hypothetical protein A2Z16_12530 [Chloroflexi bacterium RBG_16_54_18]
MDEKSLVILELPKILDRLAGYCAFQVSAEKARALQPLHELQGVRFQQELTREACQLLLAKPDIDIGGVRDIRESIDLARHGGVLDPTNLLDIKFTLMAARNLARVLDRIMVQYPKLADLGAQMPQPPGVIDAITRTVSDRGDILDSASERLSNIRHDLRIIHDRLISKLQKMVADPTISTYLQEALVTQRDGRYVLPLRAEFKGRIKAIIHDQSSSGATLFVEPFSVVELNNQYRELELNERDEIRRVLAELTHLVAEYQQDICQVVEVVAVIDLVLAKAKFAFDLNAVAPHLIPFQESKTIDNHNKDESIQRRSQGKKQTAHMNIGMNIRLFQARHPLLNPQTVVPIDVILEPGTLVLVITGPNTGGKTVTLKTVGLLVLMAQCGLHIPVENGSEISIFENIFADIGDEQSIEQSLSTFSSHITNIIRIIETANSSSLVLLDELGAGTDPQEGAALARAILNFLVERSIPSMVTTHHPELKAYAHTTRGVENASVEFNLETLKPTFHLTIGLPGRSNALAIAERLGLSPKIIQDARQDISPEDMRAEDLLDDIHRQRDAARHSRAAADLARKNAEALRSELLERLDKIEEERLQLISSARLEVQAKLEQLSEEINSVQSELNKARQPQDLLTPAEDLYLELEEKYSEPETHIEPQMGPELRQLETARRKTLRLGDKVRLRTLGTQGVLSALSDGEAEVQVGGLRVRTRLEEIEPASMVESPAEKKTELPITQGQKADRVINPHPSPGIELDLRGKRADDAQDELERYLDAAYLAGLPFVRIIHGKGTGTLREVVRKALSGYSNIRSIEAGGEREGGDGVTIARFASS